MQTFIDTATQKVWQYEDGVVVTDLNGIYSFTTALGVVLNTPTTLQPYAIPAPTPAQLLTAAQTAQIAALQSAYKSAINIPVSFKNAASITSTYPSGNTILINGQTATAMLQQVLAAGSSAWTLGKWLDTNNVAQTFTFADLQGLAAAMEAAVTLDWQDLVAKIAEAQTIANLPARAANSPYVVGNQIVDTNGNIWACTTAGTTGTTCTFPSSSLTTSTTKTDGTVVWTWVNTQLAAIAAVSF